MVNQSSGLENFEASRQEAREAHMEAIRRHERWLDEIRQKEEREREERLRMLHEGTRDVWSHVKGVLESVKILEETDKKSLEEVQKNSSEALPYHHEAEAPHDNGFSDFSLN